MTMPLATILQALTFVCVKMDIMEMVSMIAPVSILLFLFHEKIAPTFQVIFHIFGIIVCKICSTVMSLLLFYSSVMSSNVFFCLQYPAVWIAQVGCIVFYTT